MYLRVSLFAEESSNQKQMIPPCTRFTCFAAGTRFIFYSLKWNFSVVQRSQDRQQIKTNNPKINQVELLGNYERVGIFHIPPYTGPR